MSFRKATERIIMLIDMDAFFASVEQRDNPSLRGKPVFVAGRHENRGVVTTCSYEARRYGCHSGMSVFEARQLCPRGCFVTGNYKNYAEVSAEMVKLCYSVTPIVEPFSIDEVFLDVSGSAHLFGGKRNTAEKLKKKIWDKLQLPCSIGVSNGRSLAKLGSDLAKPNGIFVIDSENIVPVMDRIAVEKLFGVGRKTKAKLNMMGIFTAGQLRDFPLQALRDKFGKIGVELWNTTHGLDTGGLVPIEDTPAPKSISNEVTLFDPTLKPEVIHGILLSLVHKCCYRLRKSKASAKIVHLAVRTEDFMMQVYNRTLSVPVCYDEEVIKIVMDLWTQVKLDYKGVRLLGVGLSNLKRNNQLAQIEIFQERYEKQLHILSAIDELKKRYGEGIIHIGDARMMEKQYHRALNTTISFGMKNELKNQLADWVPGL